MVWAQLRAQFITATLAQRRSLTAYKKARGRGELKDDGGRYCRSILGRNKKELLAMSRKKPTKKELARMKAMNELGESPTSIADRWGRSHNTVIKYLESDVYNDPANR